MIKLKNVPNILTLIRLLLIPVMLLCFFLISGEDHIAAMIIFVLASLTDVLDGFIARKYHLITHLGEVLDPLADKLLKISTIIAFVIVEAIPLWLAVVLVFFDTGMIITGVILYKHRITIPSNVYGKVGTVIMSIGLIMCFFSGSLSPWNIYVLCLGLAAIILSLIVYICLNAKRVFGKEGREARRLQREAEEEANALETN